MISIEQDAFLTTIIGVFLSLVASLFAPGARMFSVGNDSVQHVVQDLGFKKMKHGVVLQMWAHCL